MDFFPHVCKSVSVEVINFSVLLQHMALVKNPIQLVQNWDKSMVWEKSTGTRDRRLRTGTVPGKTGTSGHPILLFRKVAENFVTSLARV